MKRVVSRKILLALAALIALSGPVQTMALAASLLSANAPMEPAVASVSPMTTAANDETAVERIAESSDAIGMAASSDDFDALSGRAADFDLPAPRTMKGIFSTVGMYVKMPEYAAATEAIFRVSYASSDLIIGSISSLTFYVNGTPVYSCPVAYSATGPAVLYVRLPLALFTDSYNLIQISGYVRLTDGEGCSDQNAEGNWIQFQEQSTLRVSYDIVEDGGQLSVYPYPFLSLADKRGAELNVAVSDRMDEGELAAALYTMADLGGAVQGDNEVALTNWSTADRERRIYFGLSANTPDALTALLAPDAVPNGGALIKRTRLEGIDLLLVIGDSGAALTEAARLLADDGRVAQLFVSTRAVLVGEAQIAMERAAQKETAVTNVYTLKEILGHGLMFTGPFHQEATINLPVPTDYLLSGQSRFDLTLRYSENLDFDRSMVTVYWGDVPLASRKLSREFANGDTLSIVPPADLTDVPGTYLRIAFELEVKDLVCTPRQINMPWSYVAEGSVFYLPAGRSGAFSLSSRPSPFQRSGSLDHVMVVLPDEPGMVDLELAGHVLALLGAGTDAYGELRVVRASSFDPEDADANIIAVGAGESAFARVINEHLYFSFDDNFSAFTSNESLTLDAAYARRIGVAQLILSPYASDRAVLMLSAASEDGLSFLNRLFSEQKLTWKLAGDAAMIDAKGQVTSYVMRADQPRSEPQPSLMDAIVQNQGGIVFSLIGVGAMAILLMIVALLLIRLKGHHRD